MIGGLIAIYIVASYMHFYVLLSQNIYIDTVWIMLLEVIVLGGYLIFGIIRHKYVGVSYSDSSNNKFLLK